MSQFCCKFRSQRGFSLVELMVVVAIIGVLAALAIPRFRTFQAKARQAEAKTNLAHLFTLEQAYHAENDTYINLNLGDECGENPLGFQFTNCTTGKTTKDKRYMYSVSGADSVSFLARAETEAGNNNKVMPGCNADIWTIDQDKVLIAVNDSIKNCGNATN